MVKDDLDELGHLDASASAAPWHIMNTKAGFMSATFVLKNPSKGRTYEAYGDEAQHDDVVAACLLQHPQIAAVDDGRYAANAQLIAKVRNALPELLRLARLGMEVDGDSPS